MYEYEEDSDIIGLSCTLLNPYKGYMEGTIVGDYGNTIVGIAGQQGLQIAGTPEQRRQVKPGRKELDYP